MRQQYLAFVLGGAVLLGGALVACGGGDSSGPTGISCTGGNPNLAGTWTLDTLEFVGQGPPLVAPTDATGSFVFTGTQVDVTLNIVSPPTAITGAGACTLTVEKQTADSASGKLYINGTGLIGQASGSYTFVDAATDTLHASLVSTGQTIRVVVTR